MKKQERLYDDIINLSHSVSKKHPPMPLKNRAAQFSPFAALHGHGEAIRETLRKTEKQRELGESEREVLDRKLIYLQECLAEQPDVVVTFFLQDGKKEGGRYVEFSGVVKKIDFYQGLLMMEDSTKIRLKDISDLQGKLFDNPLFDESV